jgi:hypothetical protein
MNTRLMYRRAGMVSMLIVGAIVGIVVFSGTAYAPPQGAAPVNVTDRDTPSNSADVTADGELEVTGEVTVSGTTDVNVVTTPLEVSGEVDVGNFPATQDVNVVGGTVAAQVPPATESDGQGFTVSAGGSEDRTIPAILASLVTVTGGGDDEAIITFASGDVLDPDTVFFSIGDDGDNIGPSLSVPLTQPMVISQISILCFNESEDCEVDVHVVGS